MVFPSLKLVCALGDGDVIVWNARDFHMMDGVCLYF